MPIVETIKQNNKYELIHDVTLPKNKYVIRHKNPFRFVKDFSNKRMALDFWNDLQTELLSQYEEKLWNKRFREQETPDFMYIGD